MGDCIGASDARLNFEMWHDKVPTKVRQLKNPIDDEKHKVVTCVGRAVHIIYISDKWERDKDYYPYIHEFTSSPKLYMPRTEATKLECDLGSRRTAAFFGQQSLPSCAAVALLGTVHEFVWRDPSGEEMGIPGLNGSLMLASPDCKTLIIARRGGPLFVNGGSMRIQDVGIVR